MTLDSPKSAILMFIFESSSRFSGFKSLCTTCENAWHRVTTLQLWCCAESSDKWRQAWKECLGILARHHIFHEMRLLESTFCQTHCHKGMTFTVIGCMLPRRQEEL